MINQRLLRLLLALFSLYPLFIHGSALPSIDSIKVTDNISFYRVNSSKGNTTTVVFGGAQGVLLIDPNFNQTSDLIREQIAEDFGQPVRYITSSHVHRDHIEQYGDFSKNATVIIPKPQIKDVLMWGVKSYLAFENELTLFFNDREIILSTLPNKVGHTDGDELIHFVDDNVLYLGDYYFARGYPIIDKHIGDVEGYLANLKFIVESYPADTKVIPGHSTFHPDSISLIDISELNQFYSDLAASVNAITAMYDNGMTLSEIQQQGLGPKFSLYNVDNSFKNETRWIQDIYHYLEKTKSKSGNK